MNTKLLSNGQLVAQPAGYLLRHADRITSEGASIAQMMFPSNLRLVSRVPGVSMFGVSRARQHGGAVATVGLYLLAMKACGRPRAAAEHAIVWLQSLVDWLWAQPGIPTDEEIREASKAEQQSQNAEDAAQIILHEGITAESLERAIAAIDEEEARMRALKLLLRRRLSAER